MDEKPPKHQMNRSDKSKTLSRELLGTAFHEAGHAYAHYWLKIPLESVSIIPEEDYLGLTKSASTHDISVISENPSPEEIQLSEHDIIINFAGRASELTFGFPGDRNQSKADNDNINTLLAELYPNPVTAEFAAQFYESCANDIVGGQNGRICIPLLAEELIARGKLTGEQVIEKCNLARGKPAGTNNPIITTIQG